MIRGLFHPRFKQLNRFADQELSGRKRERVAAHLARCARCRETVGFVRNLSGSAAEIRVAGPPADALDRILQRRAEGDRVILPIATPPSAPSRVQRAGPYAAASVVLIAAAGLIAVATLQADRSQLRLEPSAPRAGSEITAEYHGAMFEGDDPLRLRAEYHYLDGRIERVAAAELSPEDDGVRSGSFRLPDSVVYATFAVEDLEALRVDHNHYRLWELLVHDKEGRPAFKALAEKMDDLVGLDWESADETAREMVELYPEEVESWSRLLFVQRAVPSFGAGEDSILSSHRDRFKAFEQHFQQRKRVTGEELALLYMYARAVDDPVAVDYWRERLAKEAPGHRTNLGYRAYELSRELRDEPDRLLVALEELWQRFGPVEENIPVVGFEVAMRIGDGSAASKWAGRRLPFRPEERLPVAVALLDNPESRPTAMHWLRLELERLETADQGQRPLARSLAVHESAEQEDARKIFVALGDALIDEGEVAAGLDTLRLGAEGGWDPDRFRKAADAYLAMGDTAAALPILARAAADPETPPAFADTVWLRIGSWFPDPQWETLVHDAREEMRQHVLAQAELRYLPDEIPLLGVDGAAHDLRIMSRDRVTVVAFWSRMSPHAVNDIHQLRELVDDLERDGTRFVAVTHELPSAGFSEAVRRLNVDFPIYHDIDDAAQRAFSRPVWPTYYVVDSRGRVRFDGWELEPVRRQVAVLQMTEKLPVVAN